MIVVVARNYRSICTGGQSKQGETI